MCTKIFFQKFCSVLKFLEKIPKYRHLRKLIGKVTRPGVFSTEQSRSRSRNFMILILVTTNRKLTAEIDIDYVLFSYTGSDLWSILKFGEFQFLD